MKIGHGYCVAESSGENIAILDPLNTVPEIFLAASVAAIVGYSSTLALVLAAAQAVEDNAAQTVSWVAAICFAKVIGSARPVSAALGLRGPGYKVCRRDNLRRYGLWRCRLWCRCRVMGIDGRPVGYVLDKLKGYFPQI